MPGEAFLGKAPPDGFREVEGAGRSFTALPSSKDKPVRGVNPMIEKTKRRVADDEQLVQKIVADPSLHVDLDAEGKTIADPFDAALSGAAQKILDSRRSPRLAARERAQDLAQRLLAQRDLDLLVGQRQVLVGDEVAELRPVLVADRLLERHRQVLELRYGLDSQHPRTLDEVGRTFNVTRERIRQIENKSLQKLGALADAAKLREVAP